MRLPEAERELVTVVKEAVDFVELPTLFGRRKSTFMNNSG